MPTWNREEPKRRVGIGLGGDERTEAKTGRRRGVASHPGGIREKDKCQIRGIIHGWVGMETRPSNQADPARTLRRRHRPRHGTSVGAGPASLLQFCQLGVAPEGVRVDNLAGCLSDVTE
jgi:hypothetical protein